VPGFKLNVNGNLNAFYAALAKTVCQMHKNINEKEKCTLPFGVCKVNLFI